MQRAVIALTLALAVAGTGLAEEPAAARTRELEPVFQIQIEARIEGIAHDGDDFWLSQLGGALDPPMFHRANEQGVVQESFEQTDAWINGVRDIHFWNGLLWGSECFQVRGFNLDGSWDGSTTFMGSVVFSPSEPIAAVAHDAGSSRWFIGGDGSHVFRGTWNGVNGSTPTWTPVSQAPLPGTSGVAYDPDRNCLWLADGISNTLHKLSPGGGPSLGQLPLLDPALGSLRGICVAETETLVYLAAVIVDDDERAPGWMMLWDIEDIDDAVTPVESASWSSIKAMFR